MQQAPEAGYAAGKGEGKVLESLLKKKLVKRGKKVNGMARYLATKAGAKHVPTPSMPSAPRAIRDRARRRHICRGACLIAVTCHHAVPRHAPLACPGEGDRSSMSSSISLRRSSAPIESDHRGSVARRQVDLAESRLEDKIRQLPVELARRSLHVLSRVRSPRHGCLVARKSRRRAWLSVAALVACAGCSTYLGTTPKSFLRHVRSNPDPNMRYHRLRKAGRTRSRTTIPQDKSDAIETLVEQARRGQGADGDGPVIIRTLGELGDRRAQNAIARVANNPNAEPMLKVEAYRALGKVGRATMP